jgi:alcohol dehydrogenase (cytochrome c)/quinohemoprotein ethanol dehydrogenase
MSIRRIVSCVLLIAMASASCSRESDPPAASSAASSAASGSTPASAASRPPAAVDAQRLLAADSEPGQWMTTGRTYDEQRFSPLKQIDTANVSELGLAWYGDLTVPRAQESTPLYVDGVLYVTTAWSNVQAYDARTGQLKWAFDAKTAREWGTYACCDVVNRGAAVWNGKVYVGTIDGRLIAIDAATGKEVWSVDTLVRRDVAYTITGAPRIVKGKVLIGNGGAEYGVRGYVSAYDAETGALDWRFFTVPGDPALGFENDTLAAAARTWSGEWWKLGGGGTVWDSMAYDPELDLLYIGTGNGSPWNQALRSPGGGDNLYLSSIVALKAATGEYIWHFQTTPGETWDYTATQPLMLADLTIAEKPRKVIMQAPKNGYFYVLDRVTGEFISGAAYTSPITWSTGLDPKTGRPKEIKEARYDKTGKPAVVIPGPGGAHSWQPMSYSPLTGLVYFPVMESGFPFIPSASAPLNKRAWATGVDFNAGSLPAIAEVRAGAKAGLKGHLVAWDPVKQKEVWRAQFEHPWNGGTLATAGNLVFQGNSMGEFAAYRATNGQKLWSAPTQAGVLAAPVTYEIDGEQYVTIEVGWGGAFGLAAGELARDSHIAANLPRVLTYKLNGEAKLPPLPQTAAAKLDPPAEIGDAATWTAGKATYHMYCGVCHGDAAVSGGVLPDLRLSPVNRGADVWEKVVRGGERQDRGMVSFAEVLSSEESEKVRAYVIHRAHEDQSLEQAIAKPSAAPQ